MHTVFHIYFSIQYMVAHGQVVASSRSHQSTEVKQCGVQVMLKALCTGDGQDSHIMPPLSTQQLWVPGAGES